MDDNTGGGSCEFAQPDQSSFAAATAAAPVCNGGTIYQPPVKDDGADNFQLTNTPSTAPAATMMAMMPRARPNPHDHSPTSPEAYDSGRSQSEEDEEEDYDDEEGDEDEEEEGEEAQYSLSEFSDIHLMDVDGHRPPHQQQQAARVDPPYFRSFDASATATASASASANGGVGGRKASWAYFDALAAAAANEQQKEHSAGGDAGLGSNRKRAFSFAAASYSGGTPAAAAAAAQLTQPAANSNGERRAATKICRVCGDKAFSYNFNVITCESCKAFFRRNANKDKDIRCPFSENCVIDVVSRRFCQRCRLQKCFQVGMKKEWIMSEEARLEKKQRILDNRMRRMAERQAQEADEPEQQQQGQGRREQHHSLQDLANSAEALMAAQAPLALPVPIGIAAAAQPAADFPLLPSALQALGGLDIPSQVLAVPLAEPQQHQQLLKAAPTTTSAFCSPLAFGAMDAQPVLGSPTAAVSSVEPPMLPLTLPLPLPAPQQQLAASEAAAFVVAAQAAQAAQQLQLQQQVNELQHQAVVQAQLQQQQLAVVGAAAAMAAVASAAAQSATPSSAQELVNAAAALPPAFISSLVVDGMAAAVQQVQQAAAAAAVAVQSPTAALAFAHPQEVGAPDSHGEQQAAPPPKKCQCHCQCGRYPAEVLIVDKVMTDLLGQSSKQYETEAGAGAGDTEPPPQQRRRLSTVGPSSAQVALSNGATTAIEAMDTAGAAEEYGPLRPTDEERLNELLQANAVWETEPGETQFGVTENGLRRLVKMISCVEGFRQLDRHDQILLLRHGCESYFVLRAAPSFVEAKVPYLAQNGLSDGAISFYREFPAEWLANETVNVLLGAILLFHAEVGELNNRLAVALEQMRYQSILRRVLHALCASQPQPAAAAYAKLMELLERLRSFSLLGSGDDGSFEPIVQQIFEPPAVQQQQAAATTNGC